jgi:putative RNA 2'-phosphotransferase
MAVGQRKDHAPVLLRVAAVEAHQQGTAFYRGNDRVWLADEVPAPFIKRASGET